MGRAANCILYSCSLRGDITDRCLWETVSRHQAEPGKVRSELSVFHLFLLKLAGICLLIKIILQMLTAIPYFAELSANVIDFVVGYLHWVFLGVVSIALFAFLNYFRLLNISKTGFYIYLTGFLLSEALIFYKGLAIWLALPFFSDYFVILLIISALIPTAILMMLVRNFKIPLKHLPN